MRRQNPGRAALALILALALGACGPRQAAATPTLSVQAIYTAGYFTFEAKRATEIALTPPTSTPTLPPPPTYPPLPTAALDLTVGTPTSAVPALDTSCDNAVYLSDVTIPDKSIIQSSKAFVKTWKMMNKGTCTWSTDYRLVFLAGSSMSGTEVPLPTQVPPGQTIDISVSLVSPTDGGTYKGEWQMQNAQGLAFGSIVTVIIRVPTANDTPEPTNTSKP